MRIIIDGYNLIAALPSLRSSFPNDLETCRDELRDMLVRFKKIRGHNITVVYDGPGGQWGRGESGRVSGIREIFTPAEENADRIIIRMSRENPRGLIVVTRDRDVAMQCEKAGAAVLTPSEFESKMIEAMLFDVKGVEEVDTGPSPKVTTKKRGPSKKPKKSERLKKRRKSKL